jgi:hypothetical protein
MLRHIPHCSQLFDTCSITQLQTLCQLSQAAPVKCAAHKPNQDYKGYDLLLFILSYPAAAAVTTKSDTQGHG